MLEKKIVSALKSHSYSITAKKKIHSEVQIEATTSVNSTVYYITSLTLFPDPRLWPISLLVENDGQIKCLAGCFWHFGFNGSSCLDV